MTDEQYKRAHNLQRLITSYTMCLNGIDTQWGDEAHLGHYVQTFLSTEEKTALKEQIRANIKFLLDKRKKEFEAL